MASHFVSGLDDFDLEEYTRSIHFDELKVPQAPFQLPHSKEYTGMDGFKQMHLDMAKAAILSRSREPVYFYSDIPIEEAGQDRDFTRKWMFALAMMLRKELHIHMIHNLNRPLPEMMMGLEGWIPLYMTGLVHPYYLPSAESPFHYLTFVSGADAAEGLVVGDALQDGRYALTTNKKEMLALRARSQALFARALPLMDIYRSEHVEKLHSFQMTEANHAGSWHGLLSVMPLCTMSDELLDRILRRCRIGAEDIRRIRRHLEEQRSLFYLQLAKGTRLDEFPVLSEEEFAEHPQNLSLSFLFYEADIPYTYEEYLEHLELTRRLASGQENYEICENRQYPFRNVQITLREGKWAMVSKNKSPAIHFVIHHPLLREAMEQMAQMGNPLGEAPSTQDSGTNG